MSNAPAAAKPTPKAISWMRSNAPSSASGLAVVTGFFLLVTNADYVKGAKDYWTNSTLDEDFPSVPLCDGAHASQN